MVATGGRVDLWRAAKLAEHGDESFVEHAAIGQVFKQRRISLIERWQAVVFLQHLLAGDPIERTGSPVVVPDVEDVAIFRSDVIPDERYKPDPGLDESAGEKEPFAIFIAAIAISHTLGFESDVEGPFGLL